ncbi:hypothetical protein B0H66DRAFT_384504 [Apodospora peruviana]|uniref:Uncharacterized protein n=1 Tax=Apodospora peruviana TaxID=516989 RepID=A0AAE0HUZ7_9PEZI|nr:hypothetical protein B0H66DRAFT_384504 [Apodospora peruviana]
MPERLTSGRRIHPVDAVQHPLCPSFYQWTGSDTGGAKRAFAAAVIRDPFSVGTTTSGPNAVGPRTPGNLRAKLAVVAVQASCVGITLIFFLYYVNGLAIKLALARRGFDYRDVDRQTDRENLRSRVH